MLCHDMHYLLWLINMLILMIIKQKRKNNEKINQKNKQNKKIRKIINIIMIYGSFMSLIRVLCIINYYFWHNQPTKQLRLTDSTSFPQEESWFNRDMSHETLHRAYARVFSQTKTPSLLRSSCVCWVIWCEKL